jgi:hypothetical protein
MNKPMAITGKVETRDPNHVNYLFRVLVANVQGRRDGVYAVTVQHSWSCPAFVFDEVLNKARTTGVPCECGEKEINVEFIAELDARTAVPGGPLFKFL